MYVWVGVKNKTKEKEEKKQKKRDELECVGGVISRNITGAGTVCTYGVWLYVQFASSYLYRSVSRG